MLDDFFYFVNTFSFIMFGEKCNLKSEGKTYPVNQFGR